MASKVVMRPVFEGVGEAGIGHHLAGLDHTCQPGWEVVWSIDLGAGTCP